MRLNALGPRFESAGQGIGSFLALASEVRLFGVSSAEASVLLRGLVAPEIVDGTVVDSEAALEDLDTCGLMSSQVSQGSFSLEAMDETFDGALACLGDLPEATIFLAGVACCEAIPCSAQNEGSARAGAAPRDTIGAGLLCRLRVGDGRLVSVDVLLVVEPLDEGRRELLLLCFLAVCKACVEFCLRGGGGI